MVVSCAPSSRGHPASAPSSSHRPSFRTALQGCASSAAALFRRHTPPPPPLSASPGRPSHGPQPSAAGLGLTPIACGLASLVRQARRTPTSSNRTIAPGEPSPPPSRPAARAFYLWASAARVRPAPAAATPSLAAAEPSPPLARAIRGRPLLTNPPAIFRRSPPVLHDARAL